MPRRRLLTRRLLSPRPPGPAVGACSCRWTASFSLALLLAFTPLAAARAASQLLESVKRNPALARQMCGRFKQLNAKGQSATSSASIAAVASAQGLSPTDAEILITYVIGLNCPDVR